MRITFERSGGVAGMRLATSFETTDLPADEAQRLAELVKKTNFPKLAERLLAASPAPDQFQYSIAIAADDWQHTVVTDDGGAPAELQPLLQLLSRLARSGVGKK